VASAINKRSIVAPVGVAGGSPTCRIDIVALEGEDDDGGSGDDGRDCVVWVS